MDVPLIEFKDVTRRFGRRTILERVDLKIYEEQVTTILTNPPQGWILSAKMRSLA